MENLNNLILNHSTINESPTFSNLNLSSLNGVLFDKSLEQRRLASFQDLEVVEFWPWQIVLITCYTFAAVASFFLNIITILVLVKPERSITSELWKFLVLLCISDIGMSLFCIPTTYLQAIKQRWILPLWLCPVVNFAQFCFVFVSIWVLVVIGIDRYFAIIHPLYMMSWMRRYRLSIIAFICTLGILFGSIQWFVSKAVYRNRNGIDIWYCEETWSRQYSRYFTIFIFVSTFALPLFLLFFVYATIFLRILSHAAPGNPDPNLKRDQQNYKRKLKVLSWLVVIVILFFVCWFPINLINMLIEFKEGFLQPRSHSDAVLFYVFFFSAHFISMFHSLVNPVVYCFMSERFRKNMYRKMLVFWQIRNFFNIYSYTSENIELNIQGEPQTLTSRTRKTNTKHKGSTIANYNNHQNNILNNHLYLESNHSQKLNAQNNENFHHNLSNKISPGKITPSSNFNSVLQINEEQSIHSTT